MGVITAVLTMTISCYCYGTRFYNGELATEAHSMIVVACPKQYPIGTWFVVDGLGPVVCKDRGGAIVGNRLDLFRRTGDYVADYRWCMQWGVRRRRVEVLASPRGQSPT